MARCQHPRRAKVGFCEGVPSIRHSALRTAKSPIDRNSRSRHLGRPLGPKTNSGLQTYRSSLGFLQHAVRRLYLSCTHFS